MSWDPGGFCKRMIKEDPDSTHGKSPIHIPKEQMRYTQTTDKIYTLNQFFLKVMLTGDV